MEKYNNKEKNVIVLFVVVVAIIALNIFLSKGANNVTSDKINIVPTLQTPPTNTNSKNYDYVDMCKQYAQKVADFDSTSGSLYYSVQSYHYSNTDNACYFELHYQMEINYQGNIIVSQVYQLEAESADNLKSFFDIVGSSSAGTQEASCIVPETYYNGATTNCKYYGLEPYTTSLVNGNTYTSFYVKNSMFGNNIPPMSYSDYKALVQKRMNN